MAEDKFNQDSRPEGGEKKPTQPNVDVRTFGSDVKSVADSGGGSPKSYTPATPPPSPKLPETQAPDRPERTPLEVEKKPEMKQSFGEVFPSVSKEKTPTPAPAPMSFEAGGLGAEGVKTKKSPKGLFIGILVLIIIVGLFAVGYFFVYPFFFGGETEEAAEVPPPVSAPESSAEVPAVPEIPEVPVVTESGTTTPAEGEETATEPEAPAETTLTEHASLFVSAADASSDATLSELNVSAYKGSLEFTTAEVSVLNEQVFKDSEGVLINFTNLAGALLPGIFTENLSQSFESDFTFFTYTDSKGTWPGFIAKLGSDAVLADVQTQVAGLETSENLANLYLTDPGSQTSWKSGTVEGVSNRYLSFSLDGASLNYGWQDNLLVVSTSFSGFQETLKRLK